MLELIKAVSLGLVVLLPLANPLTTVALFLGLAGDMNFEERNRQSRQASIYVFAIMMVAWYAGNAVLDTFGISIPGRRVNRGVYWFSDAVPGETGRSVGGSKAKAG